ncbi:MAG: GAF domain-containing protein [Thermoflexales bacterium]|nr:GAF domain-containing protein [Thermoflexales bacterium]
MKDTHERIEKEAAEHAARYQAIVEHQSELICCLRTDGTITFVNEAGCRYFGKQRHELVGSHFASLIPSDEQPFVEKQHASLSPTHPIVSYEQRIGGPGGESAWQQWTARAVFDEQGQIVEIHMVGRDVTKHKWIENALRYRVELERIITTISTHFINLPLDEIDRGIGNALETIGAFAGIDRSYVFLFSRDGVQMDNTHEWCAPGIPSQRDQRQDIPIASLPWLMEQIRRLESIYIPRVADLPPGANAEKELFQAQGTRSLIIVPVAGSKRPIGFAAFDVVREENPHVDRNTGLLQMVSDIFANALERKQTELALRKRTAQLEALRQMGLVLTAELDLDGLLRSLVERAVELLEGSSGDLHIYRPEQDVLERYVALDHHPAPGPVTLRRGEGLAGKVMETERPLVVDDYQQWGEQASVYQAYPVAASVGVPIYWGEAQLRDGSPHEFLGVLDVWSDIPGMFSSADAEVLEMFAAQAAVAIKNARLVHSLQASEIERGRTEEALRRQLKELMALHAIATAGAEASDEDSLIERATHMIGETLRPDSFGVLLLNEASNSLRPHASYRGLQGWKELAVAVGQGVTGHVAADGQGRLVPDVSSEPAYLEADPTTRSELCVPLKAGEQVIGVINVESGQLNAFSQADEQLLTTMGRQLATAVQKVRLLAAERQRRHETDTLRKVTTALVSTLDLDRVLGSLLLHLERVIPYDSACVLLLEGEQVRAVAGRGFPATEQVVGQCYPATNTLFDEIQSSGSPIFLADIQHDSRLESWNHADSVRGWLGVPLTVRGVIVGYLTLASRQAAAYGEAEASLAQAFANQTAVAIENARLYTEIQNRAAELAATLAKQEELDRLKSEFIQNVSHELRTPLSVIVGYTEMLGSGDMGDLQPKQRESVTVIARRAQVLKKLVEDLITILEAEMGKLEYLPVNLAELTRKLLADLQPSIEPAQVTLSTDIAPDLPLVAGDPAHLHRMVDNLVGNALKFTPAGGSVRVRLLRDELNVRLEVSDTGIGIPPDQLDRIFDRFYQVDGSTIRRYGGVGLGLALVKEIAEAHGGQVSVQSAPGEGTSFWVSLPAWVGR